MAPISNAAIAELLRRYAAVLTLEGANRFKVKAYRRAAATIENMTEDIDRLVKSGHDLTDLPGVGAAISQILAEIVSNGKLTRLERSVEKLGPEVAELATRPGLDPKKVARVYKKLHINSLHELQDRLAKGEIGAQLGPRLEYHIRQGLDDRPCALLYSVRDLAASIERYLSALPGVTQVSSVGSLRRKKDTVGDLNFLVAAKKAQPVFAAFAKFSAVLSAEERNAAEHVYRLSSGLTVTLRCASAADWGLALLQSTGSPAHLQELADLAAKKSVQLSSESLRDSEIAVAEEASIYEGLGLAFIEPELREGRGETRAAARKKLPKLLELPDLRGDLHMHTFASDGTNSIAEMAAAGRERGYEYIAITDHSQSLKITNGLTEERLAEHIRAIDKANGKLKGFRILKSAEVDVLEDGKLDYSDSLLKELDLTICSIHSRFGLNKEQQTERIMRAMDNRYFNILGHATGRLLLKRAGYEIDMDRLIEHAKACGCFFEINSSPDRLDLSDEHAHLARAHGVKIAVNTDAHSIHELDFMTAGLNQARRGWLEAGDVLNTYPLEQLLAFLQR